MVWGQTKHIASGVEHTGSCFCLQINSLQVPQVSCCCCASLQNVVAGRPVDEDFEYTFDDPEPIQGRGEGEVCIEANLDNAKLTQVGEEWQSLQVSCHVLYNA